MERDLRNRIDKNARVLRFISRTQMFQKNRNNVKQELSYLKLFSNQEKNIVLNSMNGQIPNPLPPFGPDTISFYRRANQPKFQTRLNQTADLHPHMTYQSLYILAGVDEGNFKHYQHFVKQFETDLEKYLSCQFPEIRQMAMIVAGNKIIGREKQILKMIQMDRKQLWVLINHIYERKISINHLFPYLGDNDQIVYRSLFQMSNGKDDQIIQYIMDHQDIIQTIIKSLKHFNPEIKIYSIRILGNILAQKQQYVHTLSKYKILQYFSPFLNNSDPEVRKDICWAISNYAYEKAPSNSIIQNPILIEKLISMFQNQKQNKIKIQLSHIFSHLIAFADKKLAYQLVIEGRLLERCGQFLEIQDSQLILINLFLINKIIQLGDHFADDEEQGNFFIENIKTIGLQGKIRQKTYSEDSQISRLSSQIEEKLDDE